MRLVALLLLGCAVAESTAADTRGISTAQQADACSLLAAEEVSKALELSVDRGLRDDGGRLNGGAYEGAYASTCVWKVSGDRDLRNLELPLGGGSFAILSLISWPSGGGSVKFLQSFRDAAQNHIISSQPVKLAIGDEALWWGDGVAVRKGDLSFGISVHLVDGRSRERQIEEALATKIVARLPP